ncbi:hypothetical protein FI667_g2952, partial [Globisporangium splendens]
MEMAKDVKEILITMRETWSPEEETLLASLQTQHEHFLATMEGFSGQVSELALSMSPEARMVAHELRLKIYQNWRAILTRAAFPNSPAETAAAIDNNQHEPGCDCAACEVHHGLENYEQIIANFIRRSPKIKRSKQADFADDPDTDDSDGFEFPEWLGSIA